MRSLRDDLAFGLRLLRKAPLVSLVAIATLAVAIGASTAVFAAVNRLLLRAVPYSHPDELVVVWQTWQQKGLPQLPVLPADYVEWERDVPAASLAAFQNVELNLTGVSEPERIRGTRISASLFSILGVDAALGRVFRRDEDAPGHAAVVVLSDRFWRRRFNGDPGVSGKSVFIDGRAHTVLGVMPPDFHFSMEWSMAGLSFPRTDCWIPLALASSELLSGHDLTVIGRLAPGMTLREAQPAFDVVARRQERDHPSRNRGVGASVVALREPLVKDVRPFLFALLGAVAFVLLVAAANAANLVLGRSIARQSEFALRSALGASRLRLLRQLLAEGALLGIASGGLGIAFATWVNRLMIDFGPATLARAGDLRVGGRAVAFAALLSIAVAIALALVSFLHVRRVDVGQCLKESSRGVAAGLRVRSVRGGLVIAEIAFTVMLLVAAGVMTRSLLRLWERDPGFAPDGVLAVQVPLSAARYPDGASQAAFFSRLLPRLEALPGAGVVALTSYVPTVQSSEIFFTIEGRPAVTADDVPMGSARSVSPDYFRAMGIPLRSGRAFSAWDDGDAPRVVIVDDVTARLYWPGADAVGKRIKRGGPQSKTPWLTVVGVAGAVRQYGPESEIKPGLYFPFEQVPRQEMTAVIRSAGDPLSIAATVRRAVGDVDRDQPVGDVSTMNALLAGALAVRRFAVGVLVAFALTALGLAAAGTYAVIAFSVSQRHRELGVRMAVGALPARIFRLVFADAARLLAAGLVLGWGGSLVVAGLIRSLVVDAGGIDLATVAGVNAVLCGVTAAACYGPARRATRVDPALTLRHP